MKSRLLPAASALLLLHGAATLAADPAPDAAKAATPAACPNPPCAGAGMGMGMGAGHHHMMGRDGDDDGKSHRCMHKGMMGGPMMPHMIALPGLPPGNAKLEMQMQAEAMQKVGEIVAKYAEQVKEPAPPAKP